MEYTKYNVQYKVDNNHGQIHNKHTQGVEHVQSRVDSLFWCASDDVLSLISLVSTNVGDHVTYRLFGQKEVYQLERCQCR